MKNTRKSLWRIASSVLSVCLILSMMLSITVVFAEEAPAADAAGTVEIVVMAKDVKKGEKVASSSVKMVAVKSVNSPSNAIKNTADVVGKYAAEDLNADEYVYAEQVSKTPVNKSSKDPLVQKIGKSNADFVLVSDYVRPDTGKDVVEYLQELINVNAHKTLFFPDGEYIISHSLVTAPNPSMAVSLVFAEGSVLKAANNWEDTIVEGYVHENARCSSWNDTTCTEPQSDRHNITKNDTRFYLSALICLGQKDWGRSTAGQYNDSSDDNATFGGYYSITGGTFDGNYVADGISFDSGRETVIRNVTIKNAKHIGFATKRGIHNVSSDVTVEDMTIIGSGMKGTVGLDIIGYDSYYLDVNIYDCQIGLITRSGGNIFKNIRVYNADTEKNADMNSSYGSTVGIQDDTGGNHYFSCYVENYATAYRLSGGTTIFDSLTAAWTDNSFKTQTAFNITTGMTGALSSCKAYFCGTSATCTFFKGSVAGGAIVAPMFNSGLVDGGTGYQAYIKFDKHIIPVSELS